MIYLPTDSDKSNW